MRAAAGETGRELELEVERVAHGGHCVARHEGRVVFVRHTLPGERVRAVVTGQGGGGRFLRADAVEVLRAAPGRVERPCPYAGPGRCGGCDWQHADPVRQRQLKAAVVREQLQRLAGLDLDVVVEPVPGDRDGLRWRTRVEFAVDAGGRAGLRRHRSHDVVPLEDCLIATEDVVGTGVLRRTWSGERSVDVVAPSVGEPVVVPVPSGERSAPTVRERVVVNRPDGPWQGELEVAARGFWQVHPGAAATFVAAVLDGLEPAPGERAVDLYSGVGLFAVALSDLLGPDGAVLAVEGDRTAVRHARRNVAGRPGAPVEVRQGRVDRVLRPLVRQGITADLVVLDPPRTGAGRDVVRDVAALRPRRVAYVACDPAALARDLGHAGAEGYRVVSVRAFDAFPMTHHVECVAVLERVADRPV